MIYVQIIQLRLGIEIILIETPFQSKLIDSSTSQKSFSNSIIRYFIDLPRVT